MGKVTAASVWQEYEHMLEYNNSINLDDTVKDNENFFIGKQWEGVDSKGLPTPVFSFLKRVTMFTVASNTSDNIKINARPLTSCAGDTTLDRATNVVNAQFEALFEHNNISALIREFMRNAAVDGDGATYTYWDADADSFDGNGAIVTEIIQNTRIGFGNVSDRRVQRQPYILIKRREMTDRLKKYAKEHDCAQWDEIKEDSDDQRMDSYKDIGGKTTVVLRLWKDDETKTVWACEVVRGIIIREAWDLGLKRYPVTWMCWDYVQDNYHGQAMLTGLIPNQIYINKLFAMSAISMMTTAYPKIVYDKTRLDSWDNGVGRAIGINGGDVNNVAKILDPAQISPQIAQFIQMAQDMTQSSLGATSVALGDTRPDNTSAIIALQRAASTPNELTKQNLYQSIEELGIIYIDFMSAYYGIRKVDIDVATEVDADMMAFVGDAMEVSKNGKMAVDFDFSTLRNVPMRLKLDVGASAYWSEIASTQTLDNLLQLGQIDIIEYLERIPDGYIIDKQGLIAAVKARKAQEAAMMGGQVAPPVQQGEEAPTDFEDIPIPSGGGNGELQRRLAEML